MDRLRSSRLAAAAVVWTLLGRAEAVSQAPAIAPESARSAFAEARQACEADGGRLWGRSLCGPMLFVDPQTRAVAANQADAEGRLGEQSGVYAGTLPPSEPVANMAHRWAGVHWTMVMWPLPRERYLRTRLMLHESFHRVQAELGLPSANPANAHLDAEAGRTWLRLEWRALAEALIRRGEARRQAAEAALVFRAWRRQQHGPEAAQQERELELNEGLAEYSGVKLSGWPEWILADRAAVRLEQEQRSESLVRSFAYVSGPAYGILLDEAGVEWRKGLGPEADLGRLLGAALGVELPADAETRALQLAPEYGLAMVAAEETARAERRREVLQRNRLRYVEGPVLSVPLGPDVAYTFDPHGVESLDAAGTVYATLRVTDAWGTLEATGGALLVRDARDGPAEVRVTAPAAGAAQGGAGVRQLEGDGWTLRLADRWNAVPGARPGDFTLVRQD
jgi:hypothetical protein